MATSIHTRDLRRIALNIEQFLNYLDLPDTQERTHLESTLVDWLVQYHAYNVYIVSHQKNIHCHNNLQEHQSFSLDHENNQMTLWTDGHKIKSIDPQAYQENGQVTTIRYFK